MSQVRCWRGHGDAVSPLFLGPVQLTIGTDEQPTDGLTAIRRARALVASGFVA